MAELTIIPYSSMAPPCMKSSRPKFQPRVGGRILTGRIEKQKGHVNRQSTLAMHTFSAVLTIRTKNDATNNAPTDQARQDTVDTVMTDQVNEESLVTDTPSVTEAPVPHPPEETRKPFKLHEAIPKAGLRFPGEGEGRKRSILGRWTSENRVAQALHADMIVIHKRHTQGVISPIFHQAAEMLEGGYMSGLARHEDITADEARDIWKRFPGKLWVDSVRKWPRKLSQRQFIQFFSALAEARWAEIIQPKMDAQEPGILIRYISLFLDVADRAGFPWANGGDVFNDEDDDDYDE